MGGGGGDVVSKASPSSSTSCYIDSVKLLRSKDAYLKVFLFREIRLEVVCVRTLQLVKPLIKVLEFQRDMLDI